MMCFLFPPAILLVLLRVENAVAFVRNPSRRRVLRRPSPSRGPVAWRGVDPFPGTVDAPFRERLRMTETGGNEESSDQWVVPADFSERNERVQKLYEAPSLWTTEDIAFLREFFVYEMTRLRNWVATWRQNTGSLDKFTKYPDNFYTTAAWYVNALQTLPSGVHFVPSSKREQRDREYERQLSAITFKIQRTVIMQNIADLTAQICVRTAKDKKTTVLEEQLKLETEVLRVVIADIEQQIDLATTFEEIREFKYGLTLVSIALDEVVQTLKKKGKIKNFVWVNYFQGIKTLVEKATQVLIRYDRINGI